MADFSVFGSDSEDETEAPQQSAATLEYIKNASILSPSSSKTSTTTSSPAPPLPTPPLPPLFAAHPPTYSGPLLLVTADATIGGGRKFVAACDLPPGTLLLREQPLIPWSDDDEDATMLTRAVTHIKRLLSTLQNSSESRDILESMKHLHPVELADIPTHAISQFKSETNLPTNYELRLFFTFSCNAYDSGLYCYMSLFNHSEDPNCFKFSPDVANGIPYSEMRTTRHVKAGDQLTFSYINPREQSFKKRQQYFLTQHYFDIVHELASPSLSTVVSFDTLPPDFPKEVFASVEDALVAFEEDLQTKVKPPGAPDRLPIARGLYDACEELIEKVLPGEHRRRANATPQTSERNTADERTQVYGTNVYGAHVYGSHKLR